MLVESIIIIGREADRFSRILGEDAATFRSLREFDLWRHGLGDGVQRETVEVDVMAALRELGRPRPDLEGKVASIIGEVCERRSVPASVTDLVPDGMTYRTLLRRWKEQVPEDPKEFLERVRLLHARRLIEQQGLTQMEAASLAGYSSSWHMGQAIHRRANRNAGS